MAKRNNNRSLEQFRKYADPIMKDLMKMYKKMLLSMNTLIYSTYTHVTLSQSDITYPMERFHGKFVDMCKNNLEMLNKFVSMHRRIKTQLKKRRIDESAVKKHIKLDFELLLKYRNIFMAMVKKDMSNLAKEDLEEIEKLVLADYKAGRIKPIELPSYLKKHLTV